MNFGVILVKCFSGIMPVVVSKKILDLKNFKKSKLIEISAIIKADLGANATPQAIATE